MKYRVFESDHYKQIMNKYHVSSLLAKFIDSRGWRDDELRGLVDSHLIYHDFSLFSEAEMTLERIEEAIDGKEKICIYGDYDCDGIIATTILVQSFRKRGVEVGYHIPHRIKDGYGLNVARVEQMASKGYSLIITVDNGIKAFEAIERANELGVDVIITDHHEFEDDLPDAYSIIHTKISPDYPFKDICGGVIAYKLGTAINNNKHDKYLYTLAAITTLSDMMPLFDENRAMVKKGIQFMKENNYPSLRLLLSNYDKDYTTHSVSFSIIPKINSFGRLPDLVHPNHLVRYFFKDAPIDYMETISRKAIEINNKRKQMTFDAYQIAIKDHNHSYLYYASEDIDEGIVGLIAGRYMNEYEAPGFVMHYDKENHLFKGSARGINGFSIYDFFTKYDHYLLQWGGHEMAGGFTVDENHYQLLEDALEEELNHSHIESYKDVIDIEMNDLSIKNIESLDLLEPYGEGIEKPLFLLRNIKYDAITTFSNGKHLRINLKEITAIAYNKGHLIDEIKGYRELCLIGELTVNEFKNVKKPQLNVKDICNGI